MLDMFGLIMMSPIFMILLIVIIVLIVFVISTYNSLVSSFKNVERSRSLVDVYLKKRFDLIPNLVECVKGYSKHEKETLTEITKLRKSFEVNANEDDAKKLNKHYEKLIALVEAYPEIKAGENYLQLQKELSDVESEISASRRIYSNSITKYNTKVETFPTSLFASIFGYKTLEPIRFDVEDVNIKF